MRLRFTMRFESNDLLDAFSCPGNGWRTRGTI